MNRPYTLGNNYAAGSALGLCATFRTLPAFRQEEQTLMRVCLPLILARTGCKLGKKRRGLTLWAWLTFLPVIGPFPQMSHILAIIPFLKVL